MSPSRFLDNALCPVRAKRERRKEARPGELLEAALDLFVEKGFAATRSEEVAARAGVSKGTLFLYFPSKEELFKAVVTENLSGRFAEWNREYEEFAGSTPDMLRYCMHSWWERLGSTKMAGIYQREVVRPAHELVRRVLQRGIDRGEFAPLDLDQAIYAVIAPMMFLMLTRHSALACVDGAAPLDPQRYLAAQSEIVLQGLCTPAGRRSAAATAEAPWRPAPPAMPPPAS